MSVSRSFIAKSGSVKFIGSRRPVGSARDASVGGASIVQVMPPSRERASRGSSGLLRSIMWRSSVVYWNHAVLNPTRISFPHDQMPWFAGHPP